MQKCVVKKRSLPDGGGDHHVKAHASTRRTVTYRAPAASTPRPPHDAADGRLRGGVAVRTGRRRGIDVLGGLQQPMKLTQGLAGSISGVASDMEAAPSPPSLRIAGLRAPAGRAIVLHPLHRRQQLAVSSSHHRSRVKNDVVAFSLFETRYFFPF